VRELLLAGALCNDARLSYEADVWQISGDPTEAALLVAARKLGLGDAMLREQWPRLDAIPFESEKQFMATLHGASDDQVVFLKGAPEVILSRCENVPDEGEVPAEIERIAARGMRVLAFAKRRVAVSQEALHDDDVREGFTFLGLQGMIDPPRPEAVAAVAACHRAGIEVKMITGDHKVTARAIGQELGLGSNALSGTELERLNDHELRLVAAKHSIFARVAPEHKLRLVKALQAGGHVVAMTGDGVNDAPALKQADIGVAMGITGTSVSKEAADMVLSTTTLRASRRRSRRGGASTTTSSRRSRSCCRPPGARGHLYGGGRIFPGRGGHGAPADAADAGALDQPGGERRLGPGAGVRGARAGRHAPPPA
jgi:Ca2+-transporting ATPase